MVYYCIVCGGCRVAIVEDGTVVVHNDVPHPPELTYDEEDRPQ